MKRNKFVWTAIVALMLGTGSIVAIPACAPATQQAAVVRSPEAARAENARKAVQQIGILQQAVIDASNAGRIKKADANVIVQWTVNSLQALKVAGTQGWAVAAIQSWGRVRGLLQASPELSSWAAVVDQLLAGGF